MYTLDQLHQMQNQLHSHLHQINSMINASAKPALQSYTPQPVQDVDHLVKVSIQKHLAGVLPPLEVGAAVTAVLSTEDAKWLKDNFNFLAGFFHTQEGKDLLNTGIEQFKLYKANTF